MIRLFRAIWEALFPSDASPSLRRSGEGILLDPGKAGPSPFMVFVNGKPKAIIYPPFDDPGDNPFQAEMEAMAGRTCCQGPAAPTTRDPGKGLRW